MRLTFCSALCDVTCDVGLTSVELQVDAPSLVDDVVDDASLSLHAMATASLQHNTESVSSVGKHIVCEYKGPWFSCLVLVEYYGSV